MAINNYMKMEFPSLSENVGLARIAVASLASQLDFTVSEIDEIKVAVSEAVTNAVIHAYREKVGNVMIQASLKNGTIEIIVKDEGSGIEDIDVAKKAEYTTVKGRMGLGLVFMESFMDELTIQSVPGQGTTVRMVKAPIGAQTIDSNER